MTAWTGTDWPSIDPGETRVFSLDFTPLIALGEITATDTIASATWSCTVQSGADPSPSSRVVGSPTIAGLVVSQKHTGMLAGTAYKLQAYAVMTSGQTVTLYSHVDCSPAD